MLRSFKNFIGSLLGWHFVMNLAFMNLAVKAKQTKIGTQF